MSDRAPVLPRHVVPPRPFRMPWGMHEGMLIGDVPTEYLRFIASQKGALRDKAMAELERRLIAVAGGQA